MTTLFVSDLHIGGEQPLVAGQFIDFLQAEAVNAEAVYILGDLFEVWLGDDGVQADQQTVLDALRTLTQGGVPVYVMRGNRDVLLGRDFEKMSGCQLLPDPTLINLYGQPTLLSHGDMLCTDDAAYQEFRRMVNNAEWQKDFLGKTIPERIAEARRYRQASSESNQQKSQAIMDVNTGAVTRLMQQHGVTRLIHGHTHRPAVHELEIDGQAAQRIVLGDWYEQSSQLICDPGGCRLVTRAC